MAKDKTQFKEQPRRGKKKLIRHNTAANQEKHRLDWQPLTPDEFGAVEGFVESVEFADEQV